VPSVSFLFGAVLWFRRDRFATCAIFARGAPLPASPPSAAKTEVRGAHVPGPGGLCTAIRPTMRMGLFLFSCTLLGRSSSSKFTRAFLFVDERFRPFVLGFLEVALLEASHCARIGRHVCKCRKGSARTYKIFCPRTYSRLSGSGAAATASLASLHEAREPSGSSSGPFFRSSSSF